MTNPSEIEMSANLMPRLLLRLPENVTAQVVLTTDSGVVRQSISPYNINPSQGSVTGSARLVPIESWINDLPGQAKSCTLTVVFPHD